MTPLFEASKEKSIWEKFLSHNGGIIGIIIATIGFTNYFLVNQTVNKNVSLIVLAIGGILIVLHYITNILITNLE